MTEISIVPGASGRFRVRRDRRDHALVRRIVGKRTSMGSPVGSLGNTICQGCGGLAVVDLRHDLAAPLQPRRICQRCQAQGVGPCGQRFCELCGRDADRTAIEFVGEICAPCARRVSPVELPAALQRNARRRFVDRFCTTREQLLRVDALLEEERWHEESQLEDAAAVRRAYARYVCSVGRVHRELGLAWTPPPPPDERAPSIARRLDVLVARVLRAPNDIFVRNALLRASRREIAGLLDAFDDCPDWWPTRVTIESRVGGHGNVTLETRRLTDRLGRSAYATFKSTGASSRAPERELWNLFPTRWAAEFSCTLELQKLDQTRPAASDGRQHELALQ